MNISIRNYLYFIDVASMHKYILESDKRMEFEHFLLISRKSNIKRTNYTIVGSFFIPLRKKRFFKTKFQHFKQNPT